MNRPRVLFETLYDRFFDGWCTAARAYARAMELGGADVYLHSWLPLIYPRHASVTSEIGHMERPCPRPDLYLWSGAFGGGPEQVRVLQQVINKKQLYKIPVAFYTMFERVNVQPELVPLLNQLDGVLVPCSANLRSLQEAGVENATYVPLPCFPDDPHLRLGTPARPPETVYWIGRWEPRKQPDDLVRAFLIAFEPADGVRLVLKVGPAKWDRSPFPSPEEVIEREIPIRTSWRADEVRGAVEVVRDTLSPDEMVALHERGDVYASASRGEGIDLPAFAAKLARRRLVTVACGGPEDFVDGGDVVVPVTGGIEFPAYREIWGDGARARDYRLEDLVQALRVAVLDPPPRDEAGWDKMLDRHSCRTVAEHLRAWLDGMVRP